MFEEQTFENIMERMLEKVDSGIDRREGSVIYDALAPAAAEIRSLYLALETVLSQFYISTATYGYLKLHGENFGLEPKTATAAVVIGEFEPWDADVMGKTFSIDALNYTVTELIEDFTSDFSATYYLTCQTLGEAGNLSDGTLIPVTEIEGLESAKIIGLASAGSEAEDVETFRKRLLDSIKNPAFGGNIADYRQKVLALGGVGAVKVTPCSDGEDSAPGHVLIEILAPDYGHADETQCEYVLNQLTGGLENGLGYGIAPIGHKVHVQSPQITEINLNFVVDNSRAGEEGEMSGSELSQLEERISSYFDSLKTDWADGKDVKISMLVIAAMVSEICENPLVEITQEGLPTQEGEVGGEYSVLWSTDSSGTITARPPEIDAQALPAAGNITTGLIVRLQ